MRPDTSWTDTDPIHSTRTARRSRQRWLTTLLGALLAVPALSGAALAATGTGPAAGSPVSAHAATSASTGTAAQPANKPLPVPPPNAATGAPRITPKPKLSKSAVVRPLVAWSVTLTATVHTLWPTQFTTFTATANQDVGPTPYYLSIYADDGSLPVAICGTGTTCSVSVTRPTAVTLNYLAIVSSYPTSAWWNAANIQIVSSFQQIVWQGVSLSLAAAQNTVAVNAAATLTATTSADIGPSPFFTQIFDTTTGTRVGTCGAGTTCSVAVSQSVAATHRYIAYLANGSATMPPPAVQDTTEPIFVTWSTTGWSVHLTAAYVSGVGTPSVTAMASGDVGPTPYWIEIFDVNSGARIATCSSGSSCTAPYNTYSDVVAFVSSFDTALPPANTQASSETVATYGPPIG